MSVSHRLRRYVAEKRDLLRAAPITLLIPLFMAGAHALGADEAPSPLPPVPTTQGTDLASQVSLQVKGFHFQGNTVFSEKRLIQEAKLGRFFTIPKVTIEDLEQARRDVTLVYVNAGYINSGAILPDQNVSSGIILFKIVEGKLSQINITQRDNPGDKLAGVPAAQHRLVQDYIKDRIKVGSGPPLNITTLKDRLEVLRQDPNINRVNAELRPGATPGESTLNVETYENFSWQAGVELANNRSPSVGGERVYLLGSSTDLTGHGDALSLRYAINKGGFSHWRPSGTDDYSVDYRLPLTGYDTTIDFNFTRSNDLVTEEPFNDVNITSDSQSGSVVLRQPIYKTPEKEFALALALARRSNRTFLLAQPFSFSPGQVNGRNDVTAIRFTQDYVAKGQDQTLALRSTFSFGLDAIGSTITRDGKGDSRFMAWLGQAQYVRRLGKTDNEFIIRADAQFADDILPAIEQFSIGGTDTVRGYRENRLVRDNGIVGSVEFRIPLWHRNGRSILDLAPFFDAGYAYNHTNSKDAEPTIISSVGAGLLFNPNRHVAVQVYYGFPLKRFHDSQPNIQDQGVHFDLVLLAF